MKKQQAAFSLVEMSLVILIISLLLAAVTKGRSLIEEAKMQAIVAEVSQNKVAINSFYAKYNKYPGDFDEAITYWGAGTNANGDNNGHIEFINASSVYEGYRAWQHLYYAEMVNSPYAGTQTTSAAVIDTDVPKSKSGGGFLLDYNQYGLTNKNVMVLGTPIATTASPILASGILKPSQAMSVDVKSDDGIPTTGSVRGADGNGSVAETCVDDLNTASSSDDIYKISASSKDCIMIFKVADQ